MMRTALLCAMLAYAGCGRGYYEGRSALVWLEDLEHADQEVRDRAEEAFPQVFISDRTMLARFLNHEDPDIRVRAMRFMARREMVGPNLPDLAPFLNDSSLDVRAAAAAALVITPALPQAPARYDSHGQFDGPSSGTFLVAPQLPVLDLSQMPALIDGLRAPAEETRVLVVDTLRIIGTVRGAGSPHARGAEADAVVPPLVTALNDASPTVRRHAAWALGGFRPGGRVAAPKLVEALHDENAWVRATAAMALAHLETNEQEAFRVALIAIDHSDSDVCATAAPTFAYLASAMAKGRSTITSLKDAVPGLVRAMQEGRSPAREAAWALGSIGPDAGDAVDALIRALPDSDTRTASLRVGLGRPPCLYSSPAGSARMYIIDALGRIGSPAEMAVPALARLARTDDYDGVRRSAVRAMGKIGLQPEAAVPALTRALRDPNEHVRRDSATALAAFGSDAAKAIPDLVAALSDENEAVRHSAAKALKKITDTLVRELPSDPAKQT